MTMKNPYIRNDLLQNHSSTLIHRKNSFLPATSIPSRSHMAYNTAASLEKLTRTDCVDFNKCQDSSGQFCCSKANSNFLDVRLNVFKKEDSKEMRLVKNTIMREADFKQLMRLRNQLFISAENFAREENLSPVVMPTLSKTWMNNSNWLTRWLT